MMENVFIRLFICDIYTGMGGYIGWIDRWNKGGGWMEGFIHSFISLISIQGWVDKRMDRWNKEQRRMDGWRDLFIHLFLISLSTGTGG